MSEVALEKRIDNQEFGEPVVPYDLPDEAEELPDMLLMRLEGALHDEASWLDVEELTSLWEATNSGEDVFLRAAEHLRSHFHDVLDSGELVDLEDIEEVENYIASLDDLIGD